MVSLRALVAPAFSHCPSSSRGELIFLPTRRQLDEHDFWRLAVQGNIAVSFGTRIFLSIRLHPNSPRNPFPAHLTSADSPLFLQPRTYSRSGSLRVPIYAQDASIDLLRHDFQ